MIGKPEWFQRRKYGGWGLFPKTWQGWVYIVAIAAPLVLFQALPYWDTTTRTIVTGVWLAVLLLDVIHIMATMKNDERESKIEAIAERNAAWIMVLIATLGIIYQIFVSGANQITQVDYFLVAVVVGGWIAKALSNIILERKAL